MYKVLDLRKTACRFLNSQVLLCRDLLYMSIKVMSLFLVAYGSCKGAVYCFIMHC